MLLNVPWAVSRRSATTACWSPLPRVPGLPRSALTRTRTSILRLQALLHSLTRNHALVDGNKRLALAAVIAFCGVNGRRLTLTNDAAYEFVMEVATGDLDSVDDIAARLRTATEIRS
jgi:death-on-curing protein